MRAVRASKNLSPKESLVLNVLAPELQVPLAVVTKLANLQALNVGCEKDASAASFLIGTTEFNVPLNDKIDVSAEIERLEKDRAYYEGFLASVMKKLSNERFVNNAPAAVVEAENKKKADAEQKLASINASLAALK